MKYAVIWTETAARQLEKIDEATAGRIIDKMSKVAEDPFMYMIKLKGHDIFKVRLGDYRVIVGIDAPNQSLIVLDAGHRSKIYRRY